MKTLNKYITRSSFKKAHYLRDLGKKFYVGKIIFLSTFKIFQYHFAFSFTSIPQPIQGVASRDFLTLSKKQLWLN